MTAIICSVAHLFLARGAASHADQRRTDEASRPNEANHLPGHPASFVRFVRTVGSPHFSQLAYPREEYPGLAIDARQARVDSVAAT
jgi:hypothetical protein